MNMSLLKKLFGDYSQKEIKKVRPICDKVLALEEEYEAHIEYLLAQVTGDLEVKRLVDNVLQSFPPIYTQMATLRYAKGYVWSVVARTIYVSEATVRRMDKQVVDEIERL